jgi:two-component system sensor histidine kinase RpfC
MRLPVPPWLRWMRERLAARPDTEHEQAIVRLMLGALIVLYMLPGALVRNLEPTILVMLAYLSASILIFAHILVAPGVSPTRRVVALVCDLSTVT